MSRLQALDLVTYPWTWLAHPFQAGWGHLCPHGNGCFSGAATGCELGFLPLIPEFGGASFLFLGPTLGQPPSLG